MDSEVAAGWIGGLAGLGGAVVGAAVSVWVTRISQREQAKQNRETLEFQAQQSRESMEFQAQQNREDLAFQADQSRQSMEFQAQQAQQGRLSELDETATDAAIAELAFIDEELARVDFSVIFSRDTNPMDWEAVAKERLRLMQLAVARIPNRAVHTRVTISLDLCRQYRTAGSNQNDYVMWVRTLTTDMTEVLLAHRRGEAELPPSDSYTIRRCQERLEEAQEEARARWAILFRTDPPPFGPS